MCGICGLLSLDGAPVDPGVVESMNDTLVHRGPDSAGAFVEGAVALAARRLSIIDLEGSDQPIGNEDGRIQVVQNGEIYNYRQLRERLEHRGHRFSTQGDTEVLVHLYEERGPAFVEDLRGMFAIALWDRLERRLVLARDRFGIKPLYYRVEGGTLSFASELKALLLHDHLVTGAVVEDHVTGKEQEIHADVVINATGPWSENIAAMAGVDVPIRPSPGVLLAVRGRLCNMVINRMHRSGDGDIVLPQRALSVVGTSSWVVEDPDDLGVPADHVERMYAEGAKLIPAVRHAEQRAAWSAARPLVGSRVEGDGGRELSRTFKTFDHKETDGLEGFVTITGGKATTLRGMAELCADVICRKLDIDEPCRTRETVLLPHAAFYAAVAA